MWVRGLKPPALHLIRYKVMSHPMWVRGLKRINEQITNQIRRVASYVGAWIETLWFILLYQVLLVASYVGAWIETLQITSHELERLVASYVGAWIETGGNVISLYRKLKSHPMWVRGLKHRCVPGHR